jgi:signal transduction histidine kinase
MDTQAATIYTTVIIISITAGTILLFFVAVMLWQHRRNIAMYRAKVRAEVTTLENERTRVSADLHDSLGPLLFAVKYKIASVEVSHDDQDILDEAGLHLDDIIQRIREISNDLMPGTLLRKGVYFAIEEFIDALSTTTPVQLSFTYNTMVALPREKAVNLYRIINEIVHNTIKHAGAKSLSIELEVKGPVLVLSSQDDGKGFDYAAEKREHKGLGLRNLLSRTELMDGTIYVESGPGMGTRYDIEIPL